MHNLDEIIKIYFNYVSVPDILSKRIPAYQFPLSEYTTLAAAYLDCYSDTEQRNLYEYIQDSNNNDKNYYGLKKKRNNLNVFAALEQLAEGLFVLEENDPKCRYEYLLRLRGLEEHVDLELLIAAFLVRNMKNVSGDIALKKKFLTRNVSVDHNNLQLKRMMELGIAENHFHLYGSSPMFHLMWIQMMNDLNHKKYDSLFEQIDANPRTTRNHYKNGYIESKCKDKIMQAATIRLHLFKMLQEDDLPEHEERKALEEMSRLDDIIGDVDSLRMYGHEVQKEIRTMRSVCKIKYNREIADYAMLDAQAIEEGGFAILAGERWLLYELLKKAHVEEAGDVNDLTLCRYEWLQWFYAYLVIKNQVRNEMLQTNNKIGFENFSIYNKRKNVYADYKVMAGQALKSSLDSKNIEKFEVRITPADTAVEYARKIREIEQLISKDKKEEESIFYVFHFAKSQDEKIKQIDFPTSLKNYRHFKLRKRLDKQATALEEFRNLYPQYAKKVLGIDGCAQEIGCRPEVFAPVFRRLDKHTSAKILEQIEVPQLRKTFHVGEDFLDPVDGLRAVDEAIHFLNLKCGARIGHGTVLGISIKKWYKRKRNTIVLSKQDYLDNIVWLYHKINEFHIEGCSELLEFLMQEFESIFYSIYRKNIHTADIKRIWRESEKEYNTSGYRMTEYQYSFNIFTYYDAWKLRGDSPTLYERGYYKEPIFMTDKQRYLVNFEYAPANEVRRQRDVSILYYYYHYNRYVYEEGERRIEKYMPDCYVDGVIKVQKAMQMMVGKCGIGIECNPSSNLMISTMDSYQEHPIVQLYNKDLEKDAEKLQECLQLFVSINTDDKGVFHTSLENEYALMACAMEKMKDEQGNYIYNRQMIYQWLDNIRRMGLQQSFLGKRGDKDGC